MRVFITGGAGFIGSNAAARHLSAGDDVTVYDDLSRRGTELNRDWLVEQGGDRLSIVRGDVRDCDSLKASLSDDTEVVYHLAGQVAVTTSVADPRADFEANALGSLNLLEAVRARCPRAVVLYASTNKVYGKLDGLSVGEEPTRHVLVDLPHGVPESQPLDFHSPYGCSKGAGDQYMRDYARIYGLKTVVFRQSCIYGTRQFGVEDQGWVAYFSIAALTGRELTIYGDGKQVRDLLWVGDLLDAYRAAIDHVDRAAGRIYNIGGGPDNALSVWAELQGRLEARLERKVPVRHRDWRPGDQLVYVSDIRKAERELGWRPRVGVDDGLERLWTWLDDRLDVLTRLFS